MAENILRLTVNGIDYTGWKTVDVSRDMEELSGGFNLDLVDLKVGEKLPVVKAGDPCIISIQAVQEDEPFVILTGFIDMVTTSLDYSPEIARRYASL